MSFSADPKYITAISPNRFHFKVLVAKYEGPARFVLGIAEDIQLIGDEGFRKFLRQKINKYKQIFGDSTNAGVGTTNFERK